MLRVSGNLICGGAYAMGRGTGMILKKVADFLDKIMRGNKGIEILSDSI
jgi:hypothetical protein